MISPRTTIAKLRVRAAGSGPETEIARSALKSLEAKYPTEAALADADAEPTADREFRISGKHEDALFNRACRYLGLEVYRYKRGHAPRGKTIRIARGPRGLLDALPGIFDSLRKKLDDLHWGTTVGFLLGSMPVTEPDGPEAKPSKPLDEDARAAALAAMRIGRDQQTRRQLQEPRS